MTPDALLALVILAVSVLFLVTEWIPMEVTAMLTLGTVAVAGLVSPLEALSGFSNPAVVTVWAVFILSGGLTPHRCGQNHRSPHTAVGRQRRAGDGGDHHDHRRRHGPLS